MDVGAFVQENKRWLTGCAIGALVTLIASSVIGSIYDPEVARGATVGLLRSSQGTEVYGRSALDQAREEGEKLGAERQRLQSDLAFVQSPKYQLEGHGDAGQYLYEVGSAMKKAVLTAADERNVEVAAKDVSWPVPPGVDEIRGVLFGLELLDEVQQRLFGAHDAVRTEAPEAVGLRAIVYLKLDERRAQRNQGRSMRAGEVDLRDLVVEERVTFHVQGDEATMAKFLEACRVPGRTLAVETWQLLGPARAGDPCQLKGSVLGIAFKGAR